MTWVRVVLPTHLRNLARVDGELRLEVSDSPTFDDLLDAVEASYPVLRGTIRNHGSKERRPFIRFFASGRDISHEPREAKLPASVTSGEDTFQVVGAIAGG